MRRLVSRCLFSQRNTFVQNRLTKSSTSFLSFDDLTRKPCGLNLKYYSSATTASVDSVNVEKLRANKAKEIVEQATKLVAQDQFAEALPLFESALEILEKHAKHVDPLTPVFAKLRLAYSYQNLQKNEPSQILYESALPELARLQPGSRELGINYLNFAELLAHLHNLDGAIKYAKDAVDIIRNFHPSDSFLAAALSNYAAYFSAKKDFTSARAPCAEALRIFQRDLGRNNEYTRASFANMYQVLKELNATDELGDLEADYQTVDKSEIAKAKGLTSQEIADMTEEFGHTIKQTEPKAMPQGPVKGEKLYQRELNEFFGNYEKKGLDLADPALVPILEQETEAIENAKKQRTSLMERLHVKREQIITAKTADIPIKTEIKAKLQERQRHLASWKLFEKEQQYTQKILTEAGLTQEAMNVIDEVDPESEKQTLSYELQEEEEERLRRAQLRAEQLAAKAAASEAEGGAPEPEKKPAKAEPKKEVKKDEKKKGK